MHGKQFHGRLHGLDDQEFLEECDSLSDTLGVLPLALGTPGRAIPRIVFVEVHVGVQGGKTGLDLKDSLLPLLVAPAGARCPWLAWSTPAYCCC